MEAILYRANSVRLILVGLLSALLIPANAQRAPDAPPPPNALAQPPKPKKKAAPQVTNLPGVTTPKDNPKKPYQPVCSTEKVNGNCYVNINRLYPYSYPGFLMKPHSSVTVNVFHPLEFEKLTLELSAPANVYESTDQFGSRMTSLTPGLKGATTNAASFVAALSTPMALFDYKGFHDLDTTHATDLEKKIQATETDLLNQVTAVGNAIEFYKSYTFQTSEIYRQIRNVSLPIPRPANDPDMTPNRPSQV
jgi:hypothetical protein